MLVTASNLVQMYFGWEGVGLCSYLLIGFWYDRPSANAAAIKAFVVNRVGDFGFALGIFGTYLLFDTVNLDTIFAAVGGKESAILDFLGMHLPALEVTLRPALHRGHGKVGPARSAHVAAGCHGGPDAGLGTHSRRDDGDGRRIHGLPALADVRACAMGARARHLHRRLDRVLHGDHRAGAERHQARHRLFDLQPTRLHVLRRRRVGLLGARSSI